MKTHLNLFITVMAICLAFSVSAQALEPDAYETDETDDSHEQAGNVVLNSDTYQNRNLHDLEDQDWIKFYALGGQSYRAEANNLGSENCDIVMQLYDTNGTNLLANGDHGFDGENEYLEWKCPQDGDGIYYVKIYLYTDDMPTSCESSSYDFRMFRPLSDDPAWVWGKIVNAITGQAIKGARVTTTGKGSALSDDEGEYEIAESHGEHELIAEVDGCPKFETSITLEPSDTKEIDIVMNLVNINGDENIDLVDAILALQVTTGQNPLQTIYKQADVNGDDRIGLEEAIYALQKIARIR